MTHLYGAQVWHVFSRDLTVLPAHPAFANRIKNTCLFLPSGSWSSFTDPGRMEGWVCLVGWLHKCLARGIEPGHGHLYKY